MASYDILINENQRQLLLRVIKAGGIALTAELENEPGEMEDTNLDEVKEIYELMENLPELADKYPGLAVMFFT